ncbi:MAG TPA: small ribosomal subunit Rsm22 family protein [Alphaproteobacteria bacterium]|nr:small ribosomal subunit Rsm22 family protein [Alphaproteobacteria bacterium]
MELPRDLLAAMEGLCAGYSSAELGKAYEALSARYRREGACDDFRIQSDEEALAYVASRLPATYGAVHKALAELERLADGFAPESVLDIGAGPATATLVARDVWPSIDKAHLVEPNVPLAACGEALMKAMDFVGTYIRGTLQKMPQQEKADLVLASYVLNEVPDEAISHGVKTLWDHANDALVIVETGTPFGYKTLMKARDALIGFGAYIAAPCPHQMECPIASQEENWCHFSVRIQRSSLHRKIKPSATLAYEDEKFCYLIALRDPLSNTVAARLIGAPKGGKVLSLPLCRDDGNFEVRQTTKRDSDHGVLKRMDWGDALDK